MKRVLSFLLAVIMLISCCAVAAVAGEMDSSDEDEKPLYESLGVDAVTLNCKYSSDRQAVEISGNVNYNILVSYGKYSIGIIRIKPSQSIEEAINAKKPDIAAQMSIAAKFSFTLDIKKTAERFCKYAVVIISPEGQIILASEPTYIGVSSGKTNSSLNNFKGIAVNDMKEVSVGGDMGFGCAVIPVYYDRLINASMNGYMYPHEDTHLFFDKTYVDELDAKIRTFSVSGAKVYLQLLMPKVDATGAVVGYEMPDVYNEKTLSLLYTYVKFLSSRYNEYVNGQIGGFIVGKQIDKKIYNSSKVTSVEDYAEKYAFYLSVVANTARLENPDIDIIAPFSDADCFEGAVELSTGDYLSSKLIEEIAAVYDRDFSGGFDFNIMIESEGYVLETEISEDGAEKKYVPVENDRDSMLSIKELSRLNTFLQKLKKNYRSAPDKYIFSWDVPRDVQGSILECSYAYAYYSLIQNSATSSFVISFSKNNFNSLDEIRKTINLIDTESGVDQCSSLLPLFGVATWKDIVKGYDPLRSPSHMEYDSEDIKNTGSFKGSFSYFDFSTGDLSDWYGGAYSKSVKSDYGDGGQRVLRQLVDRALGSAHSDLFCVYAYNENYVYTPALDLKMMITDGEESSGAIYEITVTMGSGNKSVSERMTVRSGEIFDLWLNVGAFAKNNMTDYLKISTRCITGEPSEYSLWVYDISGYSSSYSSEQLDKLISDARRDIRDQLQNNNKENSDSAKYWIVFSIILGAVVIGGILMTVFRRDDTKNRTKNK